MTNETNDFIESLDASYWKDRKVVIFTTVGPLSKDAEKRNKTLEAMGDHSKSAATKMKEVLQEKGIPVYRILHFGVVGMWGPLAPDGAEMAKEQTHKLLSEL